MNGQWIIVLWALIGLIFLLKAPGVRDCFARLRKMSAFGIICVVVSLGFLADVSYTKDGVRTNQTTALPSAPSIITPGDVPSTPVQTLQSPSLPAWWKYDPTDTDGDGIPDLWEKWTHGNPLVADSHLDRDGDGLTDLEEFWNQTDPRTADTDGDGYDDGFEVTHGMNPLVSEDFTPDEPDANNNGLPDIWEAAGYIFSFHDSNNNGFDDFYEQYDLPAESDDNFDVLVNIYSTRSVLLTWGNDETPYSLVVLASTGTTVRLRLPFGEDTALRLLPMPEGVDLPLGELWKGRMHVSFASRSGERLPGNAVVSADGLIARKIVNMESVITRFADPLSEGMQVRTSGASGNTFLSTDIEFGKFDVFHMDAYHDVGDVLGPFTVINTVGLIGTTFSWYSAYGDMYPPTGIESWLTLRRLPTRLNENVTVVTTAELDASTDAYVSTPVTRCPRNAFTVNFSTSNFSPHLAETCLISVVLPGCSCQNDPGWLEIEVRRETTGGFQHVAYLDMDPSTPGVSRYGDTAKLLSQCAFTWNGMARASLPLADHPDVFDGPMGSFNRAMPAIVAGSPVPPPFYTLVVRLWNPERSQIVDMVERKIYVPQVVNLVSFGGEEAFQKAVYSQGISGTNRITLYPGCTEEETSTAFAKLPAMTRAFYPPDMNLRIVMTSCVEGRRKSVLIVSGTTQGSRRGDASGFRKRNERPDGDMAIYIESFWGTLKNSYDLMLRGNNDEILLPMTSTQFAQYIAATIAHEIGHSLGLVDSDWLEATPPGKQKNHNKTWTGLKLMDAGGLYFVGHRLNPRSTAYWLPYNLSYLKFILPKE